MKWMIAAAHGNAIEKIVAKSIMDRLSLENRLKSMCNTIGGVFYQEINACPIVQWDNRLKNLLEGVFMFESTRLSPITANMRPDAHETAKPMLMNLVQVIEKVFVDSGLISATTKNQEDATAGGGKWGNKKGKLFEMMTVLDSYMLLLSDTKKYRGLGVVLSARFQDESRVGVKNRNIDLSITDYQAERAMIERSDNGDTWDHQLGVSLKSGKDNPELHPDIVLIREESFLEQQDPEQYMAEKLAAYKKIIESGFTDPSTSKLIDKYIRECYQPKIGRGGERDPNYSNDISLADAMDLLLKRRMGINQPSAEQIAALLRAKESRRRYEADRRKRKDRQKGGVGRTATRKK
jgi:hypothetical protein